MATYKVIQDVEAEDKLVGPLTLRQFIYAGISAISLYLGFLAVTHHAGFMLVLVIPIAFTCGFFAFPWGQDQPTEVWALAKIRFFLKPRRRVWDQSGAKELVSVTAPKHIDRALTNGLNQDEVQSRLTALANTIDSRGWAVKNVNVNLNLGSPAAELPVDNSDRLVQASSLPQEVTNVDVRASDDILDETANPIAAQFDNMINASSAAHRQQIVTQMQQDDSSASAQPASGQPADYWFMHQGPQVPGKATFVDAPVVAPGAQSQPALAPQAADPTPEDEAMVQHFKEENSSITPAFGHMKTLKTPEQLAADARAAAQAAAAEKQKVTPEKQAAIMNLANDDDKDVATLARMADDGEVIISLH